MEIGGKSRGEDPETSGAGVWEGQKDRDCGRSQVDQGGKVSREAGTSLVGPVGMERNLEFILSAGGWGRRVLEQWDVAHWGLCRDRIRTAQCQGPCSKIKNFKIGKK